MDLYIRSQNRLSLTKANDLFVCKYFEKYLISNYYNEYPNDDSSIPFDLCIYGYYKSKERALEVLDEIQNILKPTLIIQNAQLAKEYGLIIEPTKTEIEELSTYVYEMPLD